MKKMIRNSLWLVIFAWSLFLNDYVIGSIVVETICIGYNFYYLRNINYFRLLLSLFVSLLFSFTFTFLGNVLPIYDLLIPFLIINNLNISLINECCFKMGCKTIGSLFYCVLFTTIIFFMIGFIIPSSTILENYKSNVLIFNSLIFLPFLFLISLCLIIKNSDLKVVNEKCIIK